MAAQPAQDDVKKWHRWFVVECNSRAWALVERANRDAAEDEAILLEAYASAYHWIAIGSAENRALAYSLLAHVHGLPGHGDLAAAYAERSYELFNGRESEPWQRAFAATAMALAAHSGGDAAAHARYYGEAVTLQAQLSPEDREIFDKTFARVPAPGGVRAGWCK